MRLATWMPAYASMTIMMDSPITLTLDRRLEIPVVSFGDETIIVDIACTYFPSADARAAYEAAGVVSLPLYVLSCGEIASGKSVVRCSLFRCIYQGSPIQSVSTSG
jgi:hypothetical protein